MGSVESQNRGNLGHLAGRRLDLLHLGRRKRHPQSRNLFGLDRDPTLNEPADVVGKRFLAENEPALATWLLLDGNYQTMTSVIARKNIQDRFFSHFLATRLDESDSQ